MLQPLRLVRFYCVSELPDTDSITYRWSGLRVWANCRENIWGPPPQEPMDDAGARGGSLWKRAAAARTGTIPRVNSPPPGAGAAEQEREVSVPALENLLGVPAVPAGPGEEAPGSADGTDAMLAIPPHIVHVEATPAPEGVRSAPRGDDAAAAAPRVPIIASVPRFPRVGKGGSGGGAGTIVRPSLSDIAGAMAGSSTDGGAGAAAGLDAVHEEDGAHGADASAESPPAPPPNVPAPSSQ